MHSPVGWLCFGILVVCTISVKSGVSGNYQIIHGHGYGYPGPIFQGIVPTIGYRNVVPQVVARNVDEHDEDYNEEQQCNHEQEESEEEQPSGSFHPNRYQMEQEEDEDEEEDDMQMEYRVYNYGGGGGHESHEDNRYDQEDSYGRQALRNNKIALKSAAQTVPRKTPSKIKTTLKKNSGREVLLNTNKIKKKKQTSQIPEKMSPIKTDSQNQDIAHERNESHKSKLQLKPVSNSHSQFVATPIADLILRLSISLAKPIGHGHANETATYFNVPIRLSNTGTGENISALNVSMSKLEADINKTNSIIARSDSFKTVAIPIKGEATANQDIDDKEDDDDIDQV